MSKRPPLQWTRFRSASWRCCWAWSSWRSRCTACSARWWAWTTPGSRVAGRICWKWSASARRLQPRSPARNCVRRLSFKKMFLPVCFTCKKSKQFYKIIIKTLSNEKISDFSFKDSHLYNVNLALSVIFFKHCKNITNKTFIVKKLNIVSYTYQV